MPAVRAPHGSKFFVNKAFGGNKIEIPLF